jgi:hypothetical protein
VLALEPASQLAINPVADLLYCTALHCTALHCIALYCTARCEHRRPWPSMPPLHRTRSVRETQLPLPAPRPPSNPPTSPSAHRYLPTYLAPPNDVPAETNKSPAALVCLRAVRSAGCWWRRGGGEEAGRRQNKGRWVG